MTTPIVMGSWSRLNPESTGNIIPNNLSAKVNTSHILCYSNIARQNINTYHPPDHFRPVYLTFRYPITESPYAMSCMLMAETAQMPGESMDLCTIPVFWSAFQPDDDPDPLQCCQTSKGNASLNGIVRSQNRCDTMNRTKTDKPRTTLLLLDRTGRLAGVDYLYNPLNSCTFLSSRGSYRGL